MNTLYVLGFQSAYYIVEKADSAVLALSLTVVYNVEL